MHHNLLGRTVYNRTTDFFTPCFMTLSYDVTKQVTCIRRTVVGSRDSATGQRHYSCRQPLVCLHVRKDPLGLRTRQDLVFKNRSFGRVGNFLSLSKVQNLFSNLFFETHKPFRETKNRCARFRDNKEQRALSLPLCY